jgi:hypothetical protein
MAASVGAKLVIYILYLAASATNRPCLPLIEKSQFLTDRNVTEAAWGVELDDNNSLI